MKHTEIINSIIKKNNLQQYLEIGVFNVDHNFNKIEVPFRIGVDPADVGTSKHAVCKTTSDEFFDVSSIEFDMIFLDGLHHADQLKKDFENSLNRLKVGGFILMHDCNPTDIKWTCVPRTINGIRQGEWTGDCYKFASNLHSYNSIDFVTIDTDYGCCLIWKDEIKKAKKEFTEITWEEFCENKKELINLISLDEFKKRFL